MPDVVVANCGTLWAMCPMTDAAKTWVNENVMLEGYQWLGNSFYVEARYAPALLEGMKESGLAIELR